MPLMAQDYAMSSMTGQVHNGAQTAGVAYQRSRGSVSFSTHHPVRIMESVR